MADGVFDFWRKYWKKKKKKTKPYEQTSMQRARSRTKETQRQAGGTSMRYHKLYGNPKSRRRELDEAGNIWNYKRKK